MNKTVNEKFQSYPPEAEKQLREIRSLIFEIAKEDGLGPIQEELKWGEPSYSCKTGSPIRLDWKPKRPGHISLFVNCKTVLIETYKEVYGDAFLYEGNREIVLPLNKPIPRQALRGCIAMALNYHKLKKLPLLGA